MFKDHFSNQAKSYTQFRPRYPRELYQFLAKLVGNTSIAWDCGAGNGQAAIDLVEFFDEVWATDASSQQIAQAIQHPRIKYSVAPAEQSSFPNQSLDLVVVAQAIHWFNFEVFYQEVHRVLKPGHGVLAVWGYGFQQSEHEQINRLINHFGQVTSAPYWPKENKLVWDGYKTIPFPLREIPAPPFHLTVEWNLTQLLGYFQSWSATQKLLKQEGQNSLEFLAEELLKLWGDPEEKLTLTCSLALRLGRLGQLGS